MIDGQYPAPSVLALQCSALTTAPDSPSRFDMHLLAVWAILPCIAALDPYIILAMSPMDPTFKHGRLL